MIIFCITIIALFCVLAGYCGHVSRAAGRARLDLQRHADAGTTVNATGGFVNAYTGETEGFTSTHSFSVGMKTYYDTELLENAREELVHAQFGRRQTLPAIKGKTVEWRKWNTLPKALRPLTEGVIPNGQKFGETSITTGISQHGMYIAITDLLDTHNVDNVLLGATEELGASAGGTEDTLVRNELLKGTNVTYCDVIDGSGNVVYTPNYRYELQSGSCRLTPQMVHKVSTKLTKLKAPKINGDYVAIIHPSVSFDLIEDPKWEEFHKYASTTEIYKREIGKLYGVRFVETTSAAIYVGDTLYNDSQRYLNIASYSGSASASAVTYGVATSYAVTVDETPGNLVGRRVIAEDATDHKLYGTWTVKGVNVSGKVLYLDSAIGSFTPADGDFLHPGEGGAEVTNNAAYSYASAGEQCAVYCTLFLGKDAFGIIDPEKGGLEMIIKSKEQIGGPLNQFSTAGYKFEFGAKILYEDRMVRVESCSSYSGSDEANDTVII